MSESLGNTGESIDKEGFEPDVTGLENAGSNEAEGGVDATVETEEQKLRVQLAEANDKLLRLFAEFDNYKRRTSKERLELIKTAGSEMVISMLPVLDDFERAMKFSQNDEGKSGVELIYQKLKSTLEAKGLKRMESIGKEFDADLHEAITNIPAPSDDMKGKVVDESECGYFFNEKVIRFAKVIVGA
jgi:molecular chaperone GrpE